MKHELHVELATPAAFPRLVSRLHSAALQVERVDLDGTRCRLVVHGAITEDRVLAVVRRLVDVRAADPVAVLRPRPVVVRQPSERVTTPHPWVSVAS